MATTLPTVGATGAAPTATQGGLANWISPYITDYLGKSQAMANSPYQMYQGPLTAGASQLQNQAFGGIGSLTAPTGMTQAANTAGQIGQQALGMGYSPTTVGAGYTAPGAYQAGQFSGGTFGAPQAQQYMNPYLQTALNPQLDEIRRQAQMTQMNNAGRMAKAGSYGGSRQAVIDAANQRDMASQMARTTGEGYNTAYDKAAQQYNADQTRRMEADRMGEQSRQFGYGQQMTAADRAASYGMDANRMNQADRQFGANYGLDALRAGLAGAEAQGRLAGQGFDAQRDILKDQMAAGDIQRGIESEGIAADLAEFNQQRDFPYEQLKFQQSMISGLPASAVAGQSTASPGILGALMQGFGTAGAINQNWGEISTLLSNLGIGE